MDELWGWATETEIKLTGVNLKDGVYISSVSSVALTGKNNSNHNNEYNHHENLFKTQMGDFFFVPDENGCGNFVAQNLGINYPTDIFFVKHQVSNDFKINKQEYPSLTNDVVDEFYYYDFYEHPEIDKSKVVIVGTSTGAISTYNVVLYGFTDEQSSRVFDFTGFPGFGLYAYVAWNGEASQDWGWTYSIQNPISLKNASSNTVDIEAGDHVVIDMDMQNNKYYKITLDLSQLSTKNIDNLLFNLEARYYDGNIRSECLIPIYSDDKNTVTLYTGLLDENFIFDINLVYETSGTLTLTAEETTLDETPQFVDLSSEIITNSTYEISNTNSYGNQYKTFAYKNTYGKIYKGTTTKKGDGYYAGYLRGESTKGNGSFVRSSDANTPTIFKFLYTDVTQTGYYILDNTDNNQVVATIVESQPPYITTDHIKYNTTNVRYEGYVDSELQYWDSNEFFDMRYTSFEPYCFGIIGDYEVRTNGLNSLIFETELGPLALCTSENMQDAEGRYGMVCWNSDNNNYKVRICLDEAWFEKEDDGNYRVRKLILNVQITFNGVFDEPFDNYCFPVTFEYKHVHDWNFDDDTGICTCSCGEERSYIYRYLSPQNARLTTFGLKGDDSAICVVKRLEYSQDFINGLTIFPSLESREKVIFIGPTKDSKLTLCGDYINYKLYISY